MISEKQLLSLSRKYDCSLELYCRVDKSLTFLADTRGVHSKDSVREEGFAIRSIRDRRLGFYSFERPTEIENAVKVALKTSKLQEKADYFFPQTQGRSSKYFDPKAESFPEWAMDDLQQMIDVHLEKKVKPLNNIIGCTASSVQITNSENGNIMQKHSNFLAISQCGYREIEADDSYQSSRYCQSPGKIARNSAECAKLAAAPKKIAAGRCRVVFDIGALSDLLHLFLPSNFGGESLRKRTTKLRRRMAVAGKGISISDDPSMKEGILPAEYDGEGFKGKKMEIVGRGIVRDFLFDMPTSAKMKGEEAGNGLRSSYLAPPAISFSNIEILGGGISDAVLECRSGVYVRSFLTSGANPVTGDFSFPLLIAYEIREGEIGRAIKGAMMNGNFFSVLKHADFETNTSVHNGLLSGRMAADLELIS